MDLPLKGVTTDGRIVQPQPTAATKTGRNPDYI